MLPLIGLCTLLPAKALAPSSEADGSELTAGVSHSLYCQPAPSLQELCRLRGACCPDIAHLLLNIFFWIPQSAIMLTAMVLNHTSSRRLGTAFQLHLQSAQHELVQTHVVVSGAASQVCWGQVRRPCPSSQRRSSGACGGSGGAAAAPRLRAHHAGRCCLDRCSTPQRLLEKQLVKAAAAM